MPNLQQYSPDYLQKLINKRPGETKLGEVVKTAGDLSKTTRFVILGLPEDIGVRGNGGIGGTPSAWPAFLPAFLNVQSTPGLCGEQIGILGHLDCTDLMNESRGHSVTELRKVVEHTIDPLVATLVEEIVVAGHIPIIIGGGHNNAYPIIKGMAKGLYGRGHIREPRINAINLDAHADFRTAEGRHSGNGFRYAFDDGYLDRYAVLGLHRNYNSPEMMAQMTGEKRIQYRFWEDIFLEDRITFDGAVAEAIDFTDRRPTGIELDLDAVAGVLASAASPSGVSPTLARKYVYRCASAADVAYLHICEGATLLDDGRRDPSTGKLIAYLVSDLIRNWEDST